MSVINGHTCIGDDGGTPNRKCDACANERCPKCKFRMADHVNGHCPVMLQDGWSPEWTCRVCGGDWLFCGHATNDRVASGRERMTI